MRYQIENEALVAEIDDMGAELRVLRDKVDGHDYLWSGDPAVWSGVAPILFPFVGGVKDGVFRYRDAEYQMTKHGFARKSVFRAAEQTAASISFVLEASEEMLQRYPFLFRLTIRFTLEGHRLKAEHIVTNAAVDGEEMWFSLGAHPALACDLGDTLRFEKSETIAAQRLVDDLLSGSEPFLDGGDAWRVEADRFMADAYILEGLASKSIVLERKNAMRNVRFHFDAPYLGIWAKPGASYVCLEPWFGVDDAATHDGELTHKVGVQRLDAGASMSLCYEIDTRI